MNTNRNRELINHLVSIYGMAMVYSTINSINISPLDSSYPRRVHRVLTSYFYNHHA